MQGGSTEKGRSFRCLGAGLKVAPPDYAVVDPDRFCAEEEMDDLADEETDFLTEIGTNSVITREPLRPAMHHITPPASESKKPSAKPALRPTATSELGSELARIRAAAPGVPRLTR